MKDDRVGPPPNGTQALRHELRTRVRRPAHVGATPFGDGPTLAAKSNEKKEKLNNKWQDSVTYVLNHKCYLCPDRPPAAWSGDSQSQIANCRGLLASDATLINLGLESAEFGLGYWRGVGKLAINDASG